MDEAGLKGFEAVSWHMIVGPAGMPKEIVDRLHGEFKRIRRRRISRCRSTAWE